MKTNKKGFTLVEIVVSLLLMSLAMVASVSLIRHTMNIFYKNNQQYQNQLIAQQALEFISEKLYNAYPVKITDYDADRQNMNSIKADGKSVYFNGQDLYDSVLKNGAYLEVYIKKAERDYSLELQIKLYKAKDALAYECKKTFVLNNLALKKEILNGIDTQPQMKWQILFE